MGQRTGSPESREPAEGPAFDLNVERVLEHWRPAHAVREIIANALDEAELSQTWEPSVSRDDGGVWHIRDWGRGLQREHLTQNESREKLANPRRVIGKFGIGLKDALAVFDRHRIAVQISSRHGDMTVATLPKHGFPEITTLHVVLSPPSDAGFVGTEVILGGLKDEEVMEAKDLFLRCAGDTVLEETTEGTVLARPKGKPARVYVNGLTVALEEKFLFSYNITSLTPTLRRALNRERQNVGRGVFTDRVKAILLAARSSAVVDILARDLARFEAGTNHDETAWLDVGLHACRILNANGKVLFVTAFQRSWAAAMIDAARREGYRIVTVPESLAHKLPNEVDLTGAPIVDLGEYGERYARSFQFVFVEQRDLTPAERSIFAQTNELLRLGGGKPAAVKAVRISERTRIDEGVGSETLGVWDAETGDIVIRRDQLKSRTSYSATLLHEVSHARTSTDDVTREFEDALTQTLGIVAEHALGERMPRRQARVSPPANDPEARLVERGVDRIRRR
jgi:hypothetical protein